MSIDLGQILIGFLGGGGIVILLVVWFIHDFEKFQKFFAFILRYLSWINKRLEYSRTAVEIQARINSGQKNINRQAALVLPHAVKIEFARNATDVETYLRKGEVIVAMGHHKDNDRNVSVATLAYVRKDLVPNARVYVDKLLMKAADLTVAKDILTLSKDKTGVSVLLREFIEAELDGDMELDTDYSMLDIVNNAGHFYRIFLMQLKRLGDKLFPTLPDRATKNEVKELARFLVNIAKRESGEEIILDFIKRRIRVKVILIAKEETVLKGPTVYDRSVKFAHRNGIEYIYMCAWGAENCQFAREVARNQERNRRLEILNTQSFEQVFDGGQKGESICIECAVNLRLKEEEVLEVPGLMLQLLEQHIDELRDGKIEICAIGRKAGIVSKIAVREITEDIDAVECVRMRINKGELVSILGNERIHVLRYDEDPIKMIGLSLYPLEQQDIEDIKINENKRSAKVYIREEAKISKAIGRDGTNVQTASELTGWSIQIRKK